MSSTRYYKRYVKHADEIVVYALPFADRLIAAADTAVSFAIDVDAGVAIETSEMLSNGDISVAVLGGLSGNSYMVAAEIATTKGEIFRQQILVRVRGRKGSRPSFGFVGALMLFDGTLLLDAKQIALAPILTIPPIVVGAWMLDGGYLFTDGNLLSLITTISGVITPPPVVPPLALSIMLGGGTLLFYDQPLVLIVNPSLVIYPGAFLLGTDAILLGANYMVLS